MCHVGRSVAAAHRTVSESAESARAQLQSHRAALHAAIDTRFDILEQGITNALSTKTVALERELCCIDSVLESWRGGCRGMRETLSELHDSELLEKQATLMTRMADLESTLRALSTAPIESPVVGLGRRCYHSSAHAISTLWTRRRPACHHS